MFLRIGELARRTGLTVRALRHYDDIALLVFDAMDMAAEPVAVPRLPHRVPFGFHGTWRPARI